MIRIAVAYQNGEVWQHFGRTESFKFYDVKGGQIIDSQVFSTNGEGHGALAQFLAVNQVSVVICGGIGMPMMSRINSYGLKVCPGVTGDADEAVRKYLAGKLEINESAIHEGCHHNHH